LLSFLLVTAVALMRLRDLVAVVMLAGIYSLIAASLFIVMDAADVAFTEAAVGAGVSTLLMLKTLTLTGRYKTPKPSRHLIAFTAVVLTAGLLIYGTHDMAPYGSIDAPSQSHVGRDYLERSLSDTGVPNVVTSILASYRGFDTLGELFVIFTAGIGVLVLFDGTGARAAIRPMLADHLVLRVVAKILIPLILMFALYVQFHGEYGPGGGFQAGVIFAAALILYCMLFGAAAARRVLSDNETRILAAVGLLLFTGVGVATVVMGGAFLDYSVLANSPVTGQLIGILLVELGVGITVAAMIFRIFLEFDDRQSAEEAQK
jgi:multicomponent Na+:H+ antiporter subunit B